MPSQGSGVFLTKTVVAKCCIPKQTPDPLGCLLLCDFARLLRRLLFAAAATARGQGQLRLRLGNTQSTVFAVCDHLSQVVDTVDGLRETVVSIRDNYHTGLT